MININIDNQVEAILPARLKNKISDFLEKKLSISEKQININIAFVSVQKIKSLNIKFRHIAKPTDVLSFPIYKDIKHIKQSPLSIIELGDIVISPDIANKNVSDYSLSTGEHLLTFLALHGTKHLIGIHHK